MAAVLAAGSATRFGGGKLDAPLHGKPVGLHICQRIERLACLTPIIVVGSEPPRFTSRLLNWQIIENAHAANGLSSSVVAAAEVALRKGAALLILLADMPFVTEVHLRNLLADPRANAATLVPDGAPGVPAFFRPASVPRLMSLKSDGGARRLLASMPGLRTVTACPETLLDIDSRADLDRAAAYMQP